MYIDSHCHLSKEYYEDLDEIINKAQAKEVDIIIISGCDKKGIIEAIETKNKYENIYATIGFHPSEVDTTTDEDLIWLENLIKENNKIIALGEIGLDYFWVKDNKEKQRTLFKKQLDIAKKIKLPVIIHSREATQETYDILKEYNLTGIIHCYSGSIEMAKKYVQLGYKLGIGGVITFKNTKLDEVVSTIDLQDITLETDSPYLAPDPYRGQQNSPENIPLIAEKIAAIKKTTKQKVGDVTSNNIKELFNIEISR